MNLLLSSQILVDTTLQPWDSEVEGQSEEAGISRPSAGWPVLNLWKCFHCHSCQCSSQTNKQWFWHLNKMFTWRPSWENFEEMVKSWLKTVCQPCLGCHLNLSFRMETYCKNKHEEGGNRNPVPALFLGPIRKISQGLENDLKGLKSPKNWEKMKFGTILEKYSQTGRKNYPGNPVPRDKINYAERRWSVKTEKDSTSNTVGCGLSTKAEVRNAALDILPEIANKNLNTLSS